MDNKMVDNNVINTAIDKLKHTRLLVIIGLVLMFLGTILPYIKYSGIFYAVKISLWKYWEGKVVLALLIANAIFFFKDYVEQYIPSLLNIPVWKKISELKYQYALVPTVIAVAFIIYLTVRLEIDFGLYSTGFYTLWFGIICIIIYLIINKGKPVIPEKRYTQQNNNYMQFQNTTNNNINTNYNNTNQNYNNINTNYNNTNQNYNNINPNYNNGYNMNNNGINYGMNQNNGTNYNQNYNVNPNNNTVNYNIPQNNNGMNYNQSYNNVNMNQNYNNGANINTNQNANNNIDNNYNNTTNPNINNFNQNINNNNFNNNNM